MNTIVDWERETPQWSAVLAVAVNCGGIASSSDSPKYDLSANPLWRLYAPLVQTGQKADQSFVIGQIGQSLDGRIATPSGHSHYINGAAALVHLHRLRALVDAVIVGVGTVVADDPQLTVRNAALRPGAAQPARVVLDPSGRIPAQAKCLQDDGARRIVVQCGTHARTDGGVEYISMSMSDGGIAPGDILAELRKRGLSRVLVEGGAKTLSRFLAAGCVQRLHVMTAPIIIGSGPTGIDLAAIDRLDDALRPQVSTFSLPGGDILFDCAFTSGAKAKAP